MFNAVTTKSIFDISAGSQISIQGTVKQVFGKSWMILDGNKAALSYAVRSYGAGLPIDDKVYYAKYRGVGFMIHNSEFKKS